jgi:hypothetical protein
LIACWRDLRGLRDPDRFEPWIRRILVHACYREGAGRGLGISRAPGGPARPGEPDLPRPWRIGTSSSAVALAPDQRALIACIYVGLPSRHGRCARTSARDRQVPAPQDRAGAAREPGRRGPRPVTP